MADTAPDTMPIQVGLAGPLPARMRVHGAGHAGKVVLLPQEG